MRRRSAFTLLELLVVICLVSITLVVLSSAVAKSGPSADNILCLSRKAQLYRSWRMYADDNGDKLVVNLHGGSALGGHGDPVFGVAWVEGWLDWTVGTDNTNAGFLVNQKYAKLAPYVGGAASLFKCPADKFLSSVQTSYGWSQRVRSVSAELTLGAGNAQTGPWDSIYKQCIKFQDLNYPTPAETVVFLDEHPDSINDPAFFNPRLANWVDIPATYHQGGAGFALADGHAEIHRWRGSLRSAPAQYIGGAIIAPAGDPDVHWMSYHASRVSTNSC